MSTTTPGETPTNTRNEPFKIVAFSGSLRAASSNRGLVHLAIRLLEEQSPGATDVELVDWIDQIPYYNEDLETDLPAVVARWRDLVGVADGLVLGMPEYNSGASAVAKNAIDWLTRPFTNAAIKGKVIAMLTSAGKGGGSNVQAGLEPFLAFYGNTVVVEPPVQVALGFQRIAPDGTTDDAEILDAVGGKMTNFVAALRAR